MPLTPRQAEVLQLIQLGLQNKVIAQRMGISTKTVKQHCQHIYYRLGVRNRTAAAMAVKP